MRFLVPSRPGDVRSPSQSRTRAARSEAATQAGPRQLASQSGFVKEAVDPAFIDDQYALMFPLHLAWDTAITVQEAKAQKLPLGKAPHGKWW